MDFENLKYTAIDFWLKNKNKFFLASGVFFIISVSYLYFLDRNKKALNESSDILISYIKGESEDFLNQDQKGAYGDIKALVNENKKEVGFDFSKFSKKDEFVFKNAFNVAKALYFCSFDEFFSYYESNKNPWNRLANNFKVLCEEAPFSKFNSNYPIYFLIGLGKNVDRII